MARSKTLLSVFWALAMVFAVHASTEAAEAEPAKESNVVQLTGDNFDELTHLYDADRGDWLIKFYAPWCGHCKRLAPIFEDLAAELKGSTTHIAEIDVEAHEEIKDRFGVSGYPTLLFFKGGKMYTFKGQRTVEGFSEFIKTGHEALDSKPVPKKRDPNAPSHVVELTATSFDTTTDVMKGTKGPWLIKFYAPWCGHCKAMAPAFDAVSQDLVGQVNIGNVDVTENRELGERFGVQGFPTLLFFANGLMYDYNDKRTVDAMTEFVTKGFKEAEGQKVPSTDGTTDEESAVVKLTTDTMDETLAAAPGVWFIKFMAPWCGHCKAMARTWEKLAQKFKDDPAVHIAKVDSTVEAELKLKFQVEGYPTLLLLDAQGKMRAYDGGRSYEALEAFVTTGYKEVEAKDVPKSPIVELTDDNFDELTRVNERGAGEWLVQFYAPWCGHCKEMAGAMLTSALTLKDYDDVHVGRVNADANPKLAMRFAVDAFPILFFMRDGKLYEFEGVRDPKLMTAFALKDYVDAESRPIPGPRGVVAKDSHPKHVVTMTTASMIKATGGGKVAKPHLLMVHAPWCGHCNKFMPTYGKVAKELLGNVVVAALDGTKDDSRAAFTAFEVRAYPTIFMLFDDSYVEYTGDRTQEDVVAFVTKGYLESAPDTVHKLPRIQDVPTPEQHNKAKKGKADDKVVEMAKSVHVVDWTAETFDTIMQGPANATSSELFLVEFYAQWCGPCRAFSPIYEEVAGELKKSSDIVSARVDGAVEDELRDRLGIRAYPEFILVDKTHRMYYSYTDKERTKAKLLAFVRGGYKSEVPKVLPNAPSALDALLHVAAGFVAELIHLVTHRWDMVAAILIVGGAIGWSIAHVKSGKKPVGKATDKANKKKNE